MRRLPRGAPSDGLTSTHATRGQGVVKHELIHEPKISPCLVGGPIGNALNNGCGRAQVPTTCPRQSSNATSSASGARVVGAHDTSLLRFKVGRCVLCEEGCK